MHSSAIVILALATAVPVFGAAASIIPAAETISHAGSQAITVGEVDEGINLVNDVFNAVQSGTQAFHDIFGRSSKSSKSLKKGPSRFRSHARQDGSEAITVSEIADGVNLVNDAFQAIQSGTDAFHDIFGRSVDPTLYAQQDASGAISVSEIKDGVALVNDAFQAVQSGANAYHDIFVRDVKPSVHARKDASGAISISEIKDGVELVNDAFQAIESGANAYHDIFGRDAGLPSRSLSPEQRLALLSKLHRPVVARQVPASEAISFSDLEDGFSILKDGYNAIQSGLSAYHNVFSRDLTRALLARQILEF